MPKKSVNMNEVDSANIDKLFETVTRDMVFTGTGYNPDKGMVLTAPEGKEETNTNDE